MLLQLRIQIHHVKCNTGCKYTKKPKVIIASLGFFDIYWRHNALFNR